MKGRQALKHPKLIDPFNRNLTYLRVSITDRCNLRCMYCVPPREKIPRLAHAQVLRYEEMLRIIRLGVQLGITKIRVTGGEPLVRKGVYGFLSELGKIEGLTDISLTTNGVLLRDHLTQIRDAGIQRLNISLDTLDPEKFKRITGRDYFAQVWEGIEAAHAMGFHPIKFNTVVMKGINDDELMDIARLSFTHPFHMRFIEYMPIGDHHLDKKVALLAPEILARLRPLGELEKIHRTREDGPAERYRFTGARGEIGIIQPLSNHFCHRCNRLRLTAGGQLRPCLLSDRQEDLKGPIRKGCLDGDIVKVFLEAVRFKPMEHRIDGVQPEAVRDVMSTIGG
jgi:cyclic pyranopterin phosphate synthase